MIALILLGIGLFTFGGTTKVTAQDYDTLSVTENSQIQNEINQINETNSTNQTNGTIPDLNISYENYKVELINYNQGDYNYKSNNTRYDFYVNEEMNTGKGIEFCAGDNCLTYQLEDMSYRNNLGEDEWISNLDNIVGQVSNKTIIYKDIFPDVDLSYEIENNGIKELFILKQKPITPAEYMGEDITLDFGGYIKFGDLDIYANGKIQTGNSFTTSKKIEFKKDNKVVFYLPKPIAWDSTNLTQDLEYEVQRKGNKIWFYVKTPYEFLENAVYPVYIDPSTLLTNLVSYYKLDNNNLSDSYGSNDGTNFGTTNTSGKIFDGRDFDGSNDYIDLGSGINSVLGSGDLTINMWLNIDSINDGARRPLYMGGSASSRDWIQFATESSQILIYFRDGTTGAPSISSGTLNENTWYMITLTRTGTSAELFIDGSSVDSGTNSEFAVNVNAVSSTTEIGSNILDGGGLYYDGSMDEIGIWSKILNSTEISFLYADGSPTEEQQYPFEAAPTDTCTYLSGNWEVNCEDNCSITDNVDIGGNNISIIGTGIFTTTANITNFKELFIAGDSSSLLCEVTCASGGCFQ